MNNRKTKLMPALMLILTVYVICGFGSFSYAQKSEGQPADLKARSDEYFKDGRYLEFLKYLGDLSAQKDTAEVAYYSMLAKSKYLESLAQAENWKEYYDNYHAFDKEIIESAARVSDKELSVFSVDGRYLAWKAHMREEDDMQEKAFEQMCKDVIEFMLEKKDTVKFSEILEKLAAENDTKYMGRLYDAYKDYLSTSGTDKQSAGQMLEMADAYLQQGKTELSRVIYERYLDIIAEKYPEEQAIAALRDIAGKFADHGFWPAKDAEFAEKVYAFMERKFGAGGYDETHAFTRAYNLQISRDYKNAMEKYEMFLKDFTNSKLIDEVYTRMGILNLYFLKQPEKAKEFFEKVVKNFKDSFYYQFCLYQAALINQWKKDEQKAVEGYNQLAKLSGHYADLAKQRLAEINSRAGLDRNVRYPLDSLYEFAEDSPLVMDLKIQPNRTFIGSPVTFTGEVQDFSAGTVQPLFTYQWYNDTGTANDPGNVNTFTTTFETPGPKIVCFSATSGNSEGTISGLIWIHDIEVSSSLKGQMFRVNEQVKFEANIIPAALEEKAFVWTWNINLGNKAVTREGNGAVYQFTEEGHYEVEVAVSTPQAKGTKKFFVDIIK